MTAKVPDSAIEHLAEEFLARVPSYIWDGETVPVPVEDIADSYTGLLVRDVDDLRVAPGAPLIGDGQTLSGLLLPELGEIWVSADEGRQWPGRRRFTIAHELGHWQMHRGAEHAVFCRAAAIEAVARPATDRPPLPVTEEEANAFAAAILMPARLLREHYAQLDRDFSRLCSTFGTSGAAMGRRLHAAIERTRR